jgi:hypothetical protein
MIGQGKWRRHCEFMQKLTQHSKTDFSNPKVRRSPKNHHSQECDRLKSQLTAIAIALRKLIVEAIRFDLAQNLE